MRIDKDTLLMKYPSTWWHDLWREGLVTGNGSIGANVYGGVKEETTMLTHHDLWHNGKEDELPDVSEAFKRQRQMMDDEQFREASWEVVNALREKGYKTKLQSQLPVADFKIKIQPNKGFENYIRAMHMDTGEVGCEWTDGAAHRTSTLFVSRKQDIIVKRLTSSENDLNVLFSMDIHQNQGSDLAERIAKHVVDSKKIDFDDRYIVYTALNDDGSLYGAVAAVCPQSGTSSITPMGIRVTNSDDIIILIKLFIKTDPTQRNETIEEIKNQLNSIKPDYEVLLNEHEKLHRELYHSAELSLYRDSGFHSNEELIMNAYSGKQPAELIEKLWRYGRYLLICGTSETTNPFPLYGIWGGEYDLIWSHNMANENTQMIYWHTYVGNLLPLQKGLYQYYNDRIPTYQKNAKNLFGMRGLYMTAGTTPGVSTPNQVVPVIMNWVGAAGWIAQHYCNYYRYTRDDAYLKAVLLPYLEEVADFYEDFIEFYPDGTIHFYPSVSPENTPLNFMPPEHIQMAHPMPTTINSTIDLAIVKEFFSSLCEIAAEHQLYKDRMPYWKKILDSIPAYRTSKDGGIREWQDDRFDERYDHRHLSHIYPVFPGFEVNSLHHKELLPAFRRAVELREIDAQTGWSMAHMAAIYARLEDGQAAMQCLNLMAKSCLTNNFFTLHNDWRGMNLSLCMDPAPVQLDAIMGYTNAVQEMLIYSSEDLLKLLPAMPQELSAGNINSFRYMNGTISMSWDVEHNRFEAHLQAIRDHEVWLQLPEEFSGYEIVREDCIMEEAEGLYRIRLHENECITICSK